MRGSRALEAATIGGLVVLAAYVVDLLAGAALSETVAGTGRAAAVIGAVVCAGVLYQVWSVRKGHTPRDHAAVAAGLLGGALAASSAFSAPSGEIFGNPLTASAGVAGLALALYGSRPAPVPTKGPR